MKKFLLLTFILGSLTLGTFSVHAQTTNTTSTITPCGSNCNLGYTPLEPIPGLTSNNGTYDLTSSTGFANLISAIFKILISGGALIAVLSLTIGGVQYMTANSLGNKKNGLDRAKASIYGILLIAAIWLILNTLNPQLLKFNFNPCPVNSGTCASINYTTTTTSGTTASTNPTVNGSGTALGTDSSVGTITGDQMRAINSSLGLTGGLTGSGVATDKALVYNPADLSPTNTAAINAFTSACQDGSFGSSLLGHARSVAIVSGSTVGASGESAMVCIAN